MNSRKLISEVYLRRSLWDANCKTYGNRDARAEDWKEIAKEMDTTITEVKNRWKHLRDSFNREIRRMPTKVSGDPPSRWIHFKHMLFLRDDLTTPSGLAGNSSSELFDGSDSHVNDALVDESYDKILGIFKQEEDAEDDSVSEESPHKKRKIYHQQEERCVISPVEDPERKNNVGFHTEHLVKNPEDYHFVMSLLPSLEQLHTRQKLIVKIEIQKLIYEALYGEQIPQSSSFVRDVNIPTTTLVKTEVIEPT